ncbi:unnamed protein product, partial [Timema podura]|nr:unnamed protein product [Timema podura]
MSHLTSRAAIRQGLLVWLLVALCCAIPHCRMFSTYQEHEIETPLPVLLMNLAIHCKVPKEHTWESFREVVGSLLLRRQLGPDFNKCLLYCMMENMKMFGPDRTTLDPISSVRHAGPYLENYDQEKMIKCIEQVNLMEFKDNARARCDRSAIFLTCFNK